MGIKLHGPHTFASCSIYFSSMRWRYSGFCQDPDLFLAGFLRWDFLYEEAGGDMASWWRRKRKERVSAVTASSIPVDLWIWLCLSVC